MFVKAYWWARFQPAPDSHTQRTEAEVTNDGDVTIMMILIFISGHVVHVIRMALTIPMHLLPVYNVISKLRFGRDMLGFTLGLPVRPRAYMVRKQRK